ncbi:AMP-binding protein [Cellulosilyticum ruminicola]|uniref:AMP-binding protein n=1 Tax=Cellulosilyticum ruminicola TaxID=425254 RepID=UPI0006D00302|nr:AMP-binding protein [Cellulosilyticum ruminicola]
MKNDIVRYIRYWSKETPDKNNYTFWSYVNGEKNEHHITCKETYENARIYASYLKKIGLQKGDRIIILAEQRAETIYGIYGSLMIGAIFILVPMVNDTNKQQRLISTIESSRAQYIIYNGQEIPNRENMSVEFINTQDMLDVNADELVEYNPDDFQDDDVAFLQYTSGSVNAPKGIMCTRKNIMAGINNLQSVYKLTQDDINVSWLPFYHVMGLVYGIFYAGYINRKEIIMTTEVFQENPLRWLRGISKYKATFILAPNSAYMTCVKMANEDEVKRLDFSSIKYMISASEIIQKSNWEAIWNTFKQCGLRREALTPNYGLSEATGGVTIGRNGLKYFEAEWKQLQNNIVTEVSGEEKVGRTLSGVGASSPVLNTVIVDIDTLEECKEGKIGEIWIQGDSVALGYWKNEEATEQTFKATLPNHEGTFLRTGDLGAIINEEVYVTGRIKEMIVINGRNIYAKDIELYVKQAIPELKSVVMYSFTVPIRKRERGIIGVEFIDSVENYKRLVTQINSIMYEYFNFEAYDIFFVAPNGLPRTDNGKLAIMKIYHAYVGKNLEILYSSLKDEREHPVSEFNESEFKIKEIFESILETKCKSSKDNFLELGGSSLEIFNLLMKVKKVFQVKVTVRDIMKNPTIEGISKLVCK